MDPRQIALKVLLDQMGVPSDISTVHDRLRIQKAVYLAQIVGLNFGYNYSWYVKGPYSTSLTQDYYQMHEAVQAGDTSYQGLILNSNLMEMLPKVSLVLQQPANLNVPDYSWYEALASAHFLMKISQKTEAETLDTLRAQKPHLNAIAQAAINHLRANGLV